MVDFPYYFAWSIPEPKVIHRYGTEKIARMTRPFILRRVKTEVLHELPEKIETTNYSDLTQEQKRSLCGLFRSNPQED